MIFEIEHYPFLDIKKVLKTYKKAQCSIWKALEHEKANLHRLEPFIETSVGIK
jgi:hypothetical protein